MVFTLAVLMDTWARAQAPLQRDPSGDAANDERQRRFMSDGKIDPEIPTHSCQPDIRAT